MNAAPNRPPKSRPSWDDAVEALETERKRLEESSDYHDNTERAGAFQRAIGFLKTLRPLKRRRARKSVPPAPHSNGQNGGAE